MDKGRPSVQGSSLQRPAYLYPQVRPLVGVLPVVTGYLGLCFFTGIFMKTAGFQKGFLVALLLLALFCKQ